MLAAFVALLGSLIPAAIKAWFAGRASPLQKEAETAGSAKQQAADATQAVKTETAIADAEAQAPATVAAVMSRLNEGTF